LDAVLLTIGRAILGGYFLYNGINHFKNREMMSGYASSKDVPMPAAAVTGTGAMLLLGGASLLLGWRPRVGAGLVAGFLAGVSPVMHAFWKIDDAQTRTGERVNFLKNMALLGAAAFAAALPEPWPASADAVARRA
jgi:uncharacterized membrane protein YphA (DoxX/SURF4 family)